MSRSSVCPTQPVIKSISFSGKVPLRYFLESKAEVLDLPCLKPLKRLQAYATEQPQSGAKKKSCSDAIFAFSLWLRPLNQSLLVQKLTLLDMAREAKFRCTMVQHFWYYVFSLHFMTGILEVSVVSQLFLVRPFPFVDWQLGNSADMAAKSILKNFSQARFVTDSELFNLLILIWLSSFSEVLLGCVFASPPRTQHVRVISWPSWLWSEYTT